MGLLHVMYLEAEKVYGCGKCKVHLSEVNEIISKSFQGRHGKAYLFNKVVNIIKGPLEDRMLMTGLHTVCDIYCIYCQSVIGWKYVYEVFSNNLNRKEPMTLLKDIKRGSIFSKGHALKNLDGYETGRL